MSKSSDLKTGTRLSSVKQQLIEKRLRGKRKNNSHLINRVSRGNDFPLSNSQHRLWFLSQLDPSNPSYNVCKAVQIDGHFNIECFRQSLQEIISRHESLRTTFTIVNGEPVQHINTSLILPFCNEDITALNEIDQSKVINSLLHKERISTFNLLTGPLIRCTMIQTSPIKHFMILSLHHIICDAWSIGIIIRELVAIYLSYAANKPNQLFTPHLQYVDYSTWQLNKLKSSDTDRQIEYWKNQLSGKTPILSLPIDRPRQKIQDFSGASVQLRIGADSVRAIRLLAEAEGCTLFMVLLSAFNLIINKYTGQDEFVVASPIANRTHPEFEDIVGFFANTLLIRAELDGNPTFKELLQRTKQTCLAAYSNQDLPFDQLVEILQPDRDPSRSPLTQVMFGLENVPSNPPKLGDIEIKTIDEEISAAKFELAVSMNEDGDQILGHLDYMTALFDRETAKNIASHYERILTVICANPNERLSKISVLNEKEIQILLESCRGPQVSYDRALNLGTLFAAQAARNPSFIAVRYNNEALTYDELNRRANRLAHFLRDRGVKKDKLVAVCIERSIDLIIAIIATWKAGAAYVPIDPAMPLKRITRILDESDPILILTSLEPIIFETAHQPIVSVGEHLLKELDSFSDNEPPAEAGPNALAYVIYTSGSTGTPKGVAIENHTVHNLLTGLAWQVPAYNSEHPQSFTLNASVAFDASVQQLVALLCGHTLDVIPSEIRIDAAKFVKFLSERNMNVLDCTPTHLESLIEEGLLENVPTLSTILVGGEAIHVDIWRQLASHPHIRSFNAYGPTECTVDVSVGSINSENPLPVLGRPLANTSIMVLDEEMRIVPVGMPGELFIGGDCLARGYLKNDQLTAERFIPYSLNHNLSFHLYRTGDLGRLKRNGTIEFIGRRDHQVKIRGYRIELGEIEAVLLRHEKILEAAVLVSNNDMGPDLVAYVAPKKGQTLDKEEVRMYLASELSDFMIPSSIIQLESLPKNSSGKIDRRALTIIQPQGRIYNLYSVAPRTRTEVEVIRIWSELLKRDDFGINDNFLDLGGHSLMATRAVARIRETLKVELPLRAFFENPTIAAVSAAIDGLQGTAQEPELPLLPRSHIGEDIPASYAQAQLWFLDQLHPNSPFYNVPAAMEFTGELNVSVFNQCVQEIVDRHESLRTIFPSVDGKPIQRVLKTLKISVSSLNLETIPEQEHKKQINQFIDTETQRPFNLETGPLIRFCLARLSPVRHIVVFTMHHINSDGWSISVVTRELAELYQAYNSGKPSPLPALKIQYPDFSEWQRQFLSGDTLKKRLEFWKMQLGGKLPILSLPTDYPRPAIRSVRGGRERHFLNSKLTRSVKDFSKKEGVTLFMTLLAGFNVLMNKYTGENDILVGTPIANRNRKELEDLIGFFAHTIVLRNNLNGDPTFSELLRSVCETTLAAYANQDFPFEQLVETLQPERNASFTPVYQVRMMLQNVPKSEIHIPGLNIKPLEYESVTSRFDLIMAFWDDGDKLEVVIDYCSDLFSAQSIKRMLHFFETLLENAISQSTIPIGALSLLTFKERDDLIKNWSLGYETKDRSFLSVSDMVRSHTISSPTNLALNYGSVQLSYQELDQKVNALAGHLRDHGVTPYSVVAILLDRSPDFIIAILAVLRTGAAYFPLDPAYPSERILLLLQDVQVGRIISTTSFAKAYKLTIPTIYLDTISFNSVQSITESIPVTPETPAYIIATSGSTGRPKAVIIPHGALSDYVQSLPEAIDFAKRECFLHTASFAFSSSVRQLFIPLCRGDCIVLASSLQIQNPETLINLICSEHVTTIDVVPSYLRACIHTLQHAPSDLIKNLQGSELRSVLCASERLGSDLTLAWSKLGLTANLYNMYGQTETTGIVSVHKISFSDHYDRIPIGHGIPNTSLYILDKKMQPVPPGFTGELYISTPRLSLGYVENSSPRESVFINNPFRSGTRIFKTGDLALQRFDGNIEYIGRTDNQVKVRGFRVELEEIESVLSQSSIVVDCAVIAMTDSQSGDSQTVAFIVPKNVLNFNPQELKLALKYNLPDYMVPSELIPITAIPRTPNGKIDRKALATFDTRQNQLVAKKAEPRSSVEKTLLSIFKEVLNLQEVGIYDNFFHLGGDSLKCIRVVNKVKQAGLSITPTQLMAYPVIAELATFISTPSNSEHYVPQETVWGSSPLIPSHHIFISQSFSSPHEQVHGFAFQMKQQFDSKMLEQAFKEIVAHHDALRIRFRLSEGEWELYYTPPLRMPKYFSSINTSSVTDDNFNKRLSEIFAETSEKLDLTKGPLIQFTQVVLGNNRPDCLIMMVHHQLMDNQSWGIILEDLTLAYRQLSHGEKVKLPDKTHSFRHWTEKIIDYASTPAAQKEAPFWLNTLEGYEAKLPVDFPGGINSAQSERTVIYRIDINKTRHFLDNTLRKIGVDMNEALLAVVLPSLIRFQNKNNLLIGIANRGREILFNDLDLTRTVGRFSVTAPALLSLDPDIDPVGAAQSIKRQIEAIPNHGIGFGILRTLSPNSDLRSKLQAVKLPEVLFSNWGDLSEINSASNDFGFPLNLKLPAWKTERPYLIVVNARIIDGALNLAWRYSENIHLPHTIENLVVDSKERFQQLLRSF